MQRVWAIVLLSAGLQACASARPVTVDSPSEAARHRAALATVIVSNATTSALTIAFRSAAPPSSEIVIGKVAAGEKGHMAPVPAGEPIILIAMKPNGTEWRLAARSLPLDAEWTWEIPRDTKFEAPPAR